MTNSQIEQSKQELKFIVELDSLLRSFSSQYLELTHTHFIWVVFGQKKIIITIFITDPTKLEKLLVVSSELYLECSPQAWRTQISKLWLKVGLLERQLMILLRELLLLIRMSLVLRHQKNYKETLNSKMLLSITHQDLILKY